MPYYEYRCAECREVFGEERSMNETSQPSCAACGASNVNRIWNANIRSGGITPDVGQGTARKTSSGGGGGCGSCSSHACGTCH